jgi:DNA excision repair protein ERCC-6
MNDEGAKGPPRFSGHRRSKSQSQEKETLAEALDVSINCKNGDLVLIPPSPDAMTDEEEGNEEALLDGNMVEDVPGRIEVHMQDGVVDSDTSDEEVPEKKTFNWIKTTPRFTRMQQKLPSDEERQHAMRELLVGKSPLDLFLLIFEGIIALIHKETNRYAQQKNFQQFYVSTEEIMSFLGILILSGYHPVPEMRHYWSLDDDLGNTAVKACMSRNRFIELKRFLHLNDNSKASGSKDKLFKLRPFLDMLSKNILRFGVFTTKLSVDESMVPYFGRFGCKMFIRGKPVRFGYKVWCLCSPSGYMFAFDVYTGKKEGAQRATSVGATTVLNLLKVCDTSLHEVYFDSFFTDPDLLVRLRDLGFRATGTIRENRTRDASLPSKVVMNKASRGDFEFCFDRREEVYLVKWKDSSVLTMASNHEGHLPLGSVKRYSVQEKKNISVNIPKCVQSYNGGMGGVDQLDKLASSYRPNIAGKKWWHNLFCHFVNVAVINAWILHRQAEEKPMTHLEFRRHVARDLMAVTSKKQVESYHATPVPSSRRLQGFGHWPETLSEEGGPQKQLRCASCSLKAGYRCKQCDVTLHPKCFEAYHTK